MEWIKKPQRDCKFLVKDKMGEVALHARGTGSGSPAHITFNTWEEMLRQKLSSNAVEGVAGVSDSGDESSLRLHTTGVLEDGPTPQVGDIIEVSLPGHQHWAVYIGDGNIVHITGRILGSGEDSVHGDCNVVQQTELERETKGCKYKVNNKYDGEIIPVPTDELVHFALKMVGEKKPYGLNCDQFALELRYGQANLDLVLRALAPIPGEMTMAAAKGVKLVGSAVNTGSEVLGSVTAMGVDLAGQGVTAISGALGTAAGKGLSVFGNMLATSAQVLGPIVAAKAEAVSSGSGALVLNAAERLAPLAESLVARSGEAEEATTQGLRDLGSSMSAGSGAVGSVVATGLSWLGSASAAGASSLIGYLKPGNEPVNAEGEKGPSNPDVLEKS
ncbi:uncharacterized protein WCC33_009285 [Rhinophrynus dorsalis]